MEPSEGFNGNGGGGGGGQQHQHQQQLPPPLQFTNTTAMGRGLGEAAEEGDIVNDFKILANYLTEEGYGGAGELARRSSRDEDLDG